METLENIEVTLVGQPYSNLVISPNNRFELAINADLKAHGSIWMGLGAIFAEI